ncbi:MAG: acetyl-CoA carboxylase carboxyl transferase subunit alpha/beta [Desulfovibrionales bacterium]|nr:acetyl-CoA carboxylase carboxyl transferase subunit alpha/beta [Desulfovibrionales bacterium]
MDIEKRIQELRDRLKYAQDIFGPTENTNVTMLEAKLEEYIAREPSLTKQDAIRQLETLEELYLFLERKLERELSAMNKVRIVRHPQRICLKDILENVYDNYTEIGGQDDYSIDPSMLIARAYITRKRGKKVHNQPVMVIGQEKGHGQEFRNGGSVKPWGNAKALHYMKVAETENIPIHTYVFTPGSYPIEDYPGAAQQIAKNLYEMAGLKVPVVSVISEGGSGGAEAIALADTRIMMSHGYYSVISPEGAAAIEGRLRGGQRAETKLIEQCAEQLKITADDNRAMGYVDWKIGEPDLGARPEHYDFFRKLRKAVISSTDEIVLNVRGVRLFRSIALKRHKGADVYVRWTLESRAKERLVWMRYMKFRRMAQHAYIDKRHWFSRSSEWTGEFFSSLYSYFRYDLLGKQHKKVTELAEDVHAEMQVVVGRSCKLWKKLISKLPFGQTEEHVDKAGLTSLSAWDEGAQSSGKWQYVSPQAKQDRAVTCPNAGAHGCLDQWAPDLFGEWAGVCSFCGHHFSMEYQWYLHNIFDPGSIFEIFSEIESMNPLKFPGFDQKLDEAKRKTGHKCGCMTFEARIEGTQVMVAMFMGAFRGGSVGAAEGEKFIRAMERARKKQLPFLSYVHGTAGIRIQEGTNGVIQMPRCTMAVRRYTEAGGLYLVLYDTNSYAGPVASFLGCSPYQFAVRSANIGFAGPGVIKETTGMDIPPNYHNAFQALSRGHIQGIWDRREIRANLVQALETMGGRNLYFR